MSPAGARRGAGRWIAGVGLVLAACASDRPKAAPELARAPTVRCPAPSELPLPALSLVAQAPVFHGELLAPPASPGKFEVELHGCLEAGPTEAEGARFLVPRPSRGAGAQSEAEGARVTVLHGGLIITHELSHPCCLRATVTAAVAKATVAVREALEGTACRCVCRSSIRTAIGLLPGDYAVALDQVDPGGAEHPILRGDAGVPRD